MTHDLRMELWTTNDVMWMFAKGIVIGASVATFICAAVF